jgi:hypothetical protein
MKTILLNVIICVVEVLSQNANMDDVSVTCDSLSSQVNADTNADRIY